MAKQTQWERLEAQKKAKLQEIAALKQAIAQAEEEHKKLVKNGEDTAQVRQFIANGKDDLKLMEEEISILENEQGAARLEYLQAKMRELEEQGQQISAELEPHRKAYEKAEATFEKAKKEWLAKKSEALDKIDRIGKQKAELRPEIDRLTLQEQDYSTDALQWRNARK